VYPILVGMEVKAFVFKALCLDWPWTRGAPAGRTYEATALARATKAAGVEHVVWSTFEDTRRWVPLSDLRHRRFEVGRAGQGVPASSIPARRAAISRRYVSIAARPRAVSR